MTTDDLIKIGFKPIPHYTVTNSHVFDIGRRRFLSIGCVGTPNEMLWLEQLDDRNDRTITDLICLHNYDYDGYLSKEKLISLTETLTKK